MDDDALKQPKTPSPVEYVSQYDYTQTRREFMLNWGAIAWGTFTMASLAGAGAAGYFMFPHVLFEPVQVFKAGRPEDFQVGVDERFKQSKAVWIIKDEKKIVALSTVCTHLGCTPNWLANEQKFKCPCHGSGFRNSGINFEGPAPRPLERFRIYRDPVDGQIVIDKNKKFQSEKGEWTNSESFLASS